MANYTLPLGVSQLNKSRQGATFTANSTGKIIRSRRGSRITNNETTTQRKSNFRAIVAHWDGLILGFKTQWNLQASSTPFINSVGGIYFLSGFQLFVKTNLIVTRSGDPIQEQWGPTPPAPANLMSLLTWANGPNTILMSISSPPAASSWNYRIMATRFTGGGEVMNYPSDYLWIREFVSRIVTNENMTDFYEDKHGTIPTFEPGSPQEWNCWFALVLVSRSSGLTFLANQFKSTYVP